jgi:hypothetical protein
LGSERPRPPLLAWLRRAARSEAAPRLILRGSLLLEAWCPDRGRPPADVDYVMAGDFDPVAVEALARSLAAVPDEAGPALAVERTELIWRETPFPGLRAHVVVPGGEAPGFHVDFAFGDPLSLPPRLASIAGVGPVLGIAPETLFAWKLHGIVEFGRGRWRAKDLYDLDLMGTALALDHAALRPAVALAFTSRGLPLGALDDFRTRDTWGASRGGQRKWRALAKHLPARATLPAFLEARGRVRAAVDAILGAGVDG